MFEDKNKYLTKEELESLPIIPYIEIGDQHVLRYGLVYDRLTGLAINKIADFTSYDKKFSKDIGSPKSGVEYLEEMPILSAIPWTELSQQNFPEEEWRIHGLIPMRGLVLIVAPSGEKKSWFALEMAKCISAGTHFLSNEIFKTNRGKVLYIDAEMGVKELQKRCRLVGMDTVPEKYSPMIISGQEVNLKENFAFEMLEEYLESAEIDVVIIDTFRAVAGGIKEDEAHIVREFLQRFNRLKNKGILTILLDHCRKPDKGSHGVPKKEYVLGSQDKVANAECVLMIKGDVNPSFFTVHQVKNRTGIEIKPFNVGIRDINDPKTNRVLTVEMNYEGELDEQTFKIDTAKQVIPTILTHEFQTTKVVLDILKKDHDISERYGREALRILTTNGEIEQAKDGRSHAFRSINASLFEPMITANVVGNAQIN